MAEEVRRTDHSPHAEWRRTLTAILSAMIVSAVVWGIVVLFDVR
jgi:hypothetical protein